MQKRVAKFIPDVLENLNAEIITQYGSVKSFSEQKGFNRHVLSKVFSGRQNITLGLYLDLCVSLGVLPPGDNTLPRHGVTLAEYLDILEISSGKIVNSFLILSLGGE